MFNLYLQDTISNNTIYFQGFQSLRFIFQR